MLKAALNISMSVESGLDFLHDKGYILWDLKPESLMKLYEVMNEISVDLTAGAHETALLSDGEGASGRRPRRRHSHFSGLQAR